MQTKSVSDVPKVPIVPGVSTVESVHFNAKNSAKLQCRSFMRSRIVESIVRLFQATGELKCVLNTLSSRGAQRLNDLNGWNEAQRGGTS
jgi:hypothetical protein